jgi:hypothetical protein
MDGTYVDRMQSSDSCAACTVQAVYVNFRLKMERILGQQNEFSCSHKHDEYKSIHRCQ